MTTVVPVEARSLLFVPGDRPERFEKAARAGADAVIIDLEDAVAPAAKGVALGHALAWLAGGHAAVVRVNDAATSWHAEEIAALGGTGAYVMVPKSQSAEELADIVARLGGHGRVIALVETAVGIRDAAAVAAVPGVVRLALGNVDLAVDLGVDPASHAALAYARGHLVVASAAARIAPPVDGVTTDLGTLTTLTSDLQVTRELGFGGKLCIHPSQVGAVNGAFEPNEAEIAWARRIVDAVRGDGGVAVVGGAMVDPPVVARAVALLARCTGRP